MNEVKCLGKRMLIVIGLYYKVFSKHKISNFYDFVNSDRLMATH